MAWHAGKGAFDPFGLELPYSPPREQAALTWGGGVEPGLGAFAGEIEPYHMAQRDRPSPLSPLPPSPGPVPSGPGVTFPSGLVLSLAPGATRPGEEHYDPIGPNLPLLETGPAVQGLQISKDFKVKEFVTSGGRAASVARISPELVSTVQALRDHVDKAVTINSGYRSYGYNRKLYCERYKKDRPTNSRHSSGQAVDLVIAGGLTGVQQAKMAIDAVGPDIGIGLAPGFIHLDVRGCLEVWKYAGGVTAANIAEVVAYARARGGTRCTERKKLAPLCKDSAAATPARATQPPSPTAIGRMAVDKVPLLASHKGTRPDMILRWNDLSRADKIDVVVHFHGYADAQKSKMQLHRHKEAVSGLDFIDPDGSGAGRTRPTLAIIPRGDWRATAKHPGAYRFTALFAKGALDALIDEALATVGAGYLKTFSRGRLILTAHSGGGAGIDDVLGQGADPDEIHLFDATYTDDSKTLLAWAGKRIVREIASPAVPAPALRTVFNPNSGTGPGARALAKGLCALLAGPGGARLAPCFRVDQAKVLHDNIPPRFGWRLLADAGVTLPDVTTLACPGATIKEAFDEGEDEELDWLAYEGAADQAEEESWLGETEAEGWPGEGEDFEAERSECPHCAGESMVEDSLAEDGEEAEGWLHEDDEQALDWLAIEPEAEAEEERWEEAEGELLDYKDEDSEGPVFEGELTEAQRREYDSFGSYKNAFEGGAAGFEDVYELLKAHFGSIAQAAAYYRDVAPVRFLSRNVPAHRPTLGARLDAASALIAATPQLRDALASRDFQIGGLNIRRNRNATGRLSNHSFAKAIDVDSNYNPNLNGRAPARALRAVTGDGLYLGEATLRIRRGGTALDLLPFIRQLREASDRFKAAFADAAAVETAMQAYIFGGGSRNRAAYDPAQSFALLPLVRVIAEARGATRRSLAEALVARLTPIWINLALLNERKIAEAGEERASCENCTLKSGGAKMKALRADEASR